MVLPLIWGSFCLAGVVQVCLSALVFPLELSHLVALASLVCVNGASHLMSAPAEKLLFAILPTLRLPLLVGWLAGAAAYP